MTYTITYILVYIVLFLMAVFSGSLIFFIRSENRTSLRLLLAFSGAFLIGICFLDLIPEVFASDVKFIGLFVMAGFLIQLVLELITEGAEHGHAHVHDEDERMSPFLLLFGICIHSFLEGMPIVSHFGEKIQYTLVLGIIIHNIPISITLMSLFLHYGCSRKKAILYLLLFALMTPLGSVFSNLFTFTNTLDMERFNHYILAIVIGIFLHVSTSILFETGENHRYNIRKFLAVCLGLLMSFGISLL
jgi:zinc transporter ZupT